MKNLREQINTDYITAFKNKESAKKLFLSVLKGDIESEFKRSGKDDDETVLGIVKKMEKSLKQTNTEQSLSELEYIKPYLPELMDEVLIESIIKSYINTGINNFGGLMKQFNSEYKGKADNKLVGEIIKKQLQ